MYDTVYLTLQQNNRDILLNDIPKHLECVSEHRYKCNTQIVGYLGNLKVTINEQTVKIQNSFCKWYLGNNYNSLSINDTEDTINKISDTLHIDISEARVTRLDIASNIILNDEVIKYLQHLGNYPRSEKVTYRNGIYYKKKNNMLLFYDKNIETQKHKEYIPLEFQQKNILRYEQRYTQRIATQLKRNNITARLLYNSDFYYDIVKKWKEAYYNIRKIEEIKSYIYMKSIKDFKQLGVLSLIKNLGGEDNLLKQIEEGQKQGTITKKQAFDLRRIISKSIANKKKVLVASEFIKELDKKIQEI